VKLAWDIEKFHDYVKIQMRGLAARGATMDEGNVITNLQLAYLTVEDATFKNYMVRLQDDYNDERRQFNVEGLMDLAVNKYKTLKEAGQWQASSPEQEKIIALTATIQQLEKQMYDHARNLEFEQAARLRDQLQGLGDVGGKARCA
jgi:excinuclease UvrABC helicase subunit UvrB